MATVSLRNFTVATEKTGHASHDGASEVFLTMLWFGLIAGCLELGLFLAQRAVNPHLSMDTLLTNRHFVWMIPAGDVLIFGVLGVSIALLARFHRECALWITMRLPIGLSIATVLLSIEGLHAIAVMILALGLAAMIGPWLERRAAGFARLVRRSVPVMALGLVVLSVTDYARIQMAENHSFTDRPSAKPGAPNVLLIVLDTVRAANLSLYGYDRTTTPNLERLASRGVLFWEARTTAPWTLPSHASMMTGRWPHELSVGPDLPLDATFPTLAEVLEREGYDTAGFVGNAYYCHSLYGIGRGFARYEDTYESRAVSLFETVRSSGLGRRVLQVFGYPIRFCIGETPVRKTAAMLNRDFLGWLSSRPNNRPFFAFLNYYDAHRPYDISGDAHQRFGLAALPLAERNEIDKRFLELAEEKPVPDDLSDQKIATATQIVNAAFTMYSDSYDSSIAYLDRQVGLLLDEMERLGSLENTLLIITSDHGEQIGERGLIGHGTSLYRTEVHVPLLVIPPSSSSKTARIVHDPVSLREIPATVAEWVGLGLRSPFPGRSLTRFLAGVTERFAETSPVLCEVPHFEIYPPSANIPSSLGTVRSIVSQDRVYIHGEGGHEELYDLLNDRMELVDLAKFPQSQPVIERFRAELSRHFRHAIAPDH